LAAHHRLKVQITLTMTGTSTRRTVIRRTLNLSAPRKHTHG
jgi:hypothetical protein